jgi:hypothetical protein
MALGLSARARARNQPGFQCPCHFTRLLRKVPNHVLQFLLADSVRLIQAELGARGAPTIECESLDTKHILAWVEENNPKAYVSHRYD